MILAAESNGRLVLGRELASQADIPPNYLSKLMLTLAAAGVVEAVRGNNGGYRLRRAAATVRLIDVVKLFDRQVEPNACFLGMREQCSERTPCPAHDAWRNVKAELLEFLEQKTLADICATPNNARQMTGGSA